MTGRPGERLFWRGFDELTTAPEARAGGLGRRPMAEPVTEMRRGFPAVSMASSAQSRRERFHASFDFRPISVDYVNASLLHCDVGLGRDD